MKAVRFHKTGAPEVLIYEEISTPAPKEGEVLIKIEAVGLNFADVMRRRGDNYPEPSPLPFLLGVEVAGTIAELGEGITALQVGMRVLATPGTGGYAQYICVPAAIVVPLPDGISFVEAASIVAHGLSASIALKNAAKLQAGESILIEAAAGGLGSFAVQLAKLYGAGKVIAAASTPEKRAIAESLGADASVDYTKPNWAEEVKKLTNGQGVNIIIETAGGETANEALDAMAPFGRMIYLGQSSGLDAQIEPWKLTTANQTITGFYINAFAAVPNLVQETLGELIGFVISGQLSVQVGVVLPLSRAVEAHRLLESRQTKGKVILQPWIES